MRHMILLATILSLTACSGDGNGNGPTGPTNASIGGSWDYSVTNLSATIQGIGFSCNASDRTLNINQTGATFSGNATGGLLTCQAGTEQESVLLGSEPIVNGTVSGNSVAFDFSTADFHHTGSVSGNSMSGSCTALLDFGGSIGVVTMTGSWGAVRLSGSGSVRDIQGPSTTEGLRLLVQ
jgi:hypothetical protein